MTDTVLAALGLALRGGNLAVGEEPVAEACRTGKARVGVALGRASCAVAAVTEPGLAALVLSRLAEEEKARYGQVAALLEGRARQTREKSGRRKPRPSEPAPVEPGKRAKHGSVN